MPSPRIRSTWKLICPAFALVLCVTAGPRAQAEPPGVAQASAGQADVVLGARHGVALRTNGEVLTWGDNVGCQLGRAGGNTSSTPAVMMRNVKEIAAAGEHSLALTVDGKVYAWGQNGYGQLGIGNTYDHCAGPVLVPSLEGRTIAHIATGIGFSLAVTTSGDLLCSGDNGMGQCPAAKGGRSEVFVPAGIPALAGNVVAVRAGGFHGLALTRDGRLFAFGRGRDGQLGNGRGVNAAAPVPELTNVTSFAAGIWHSVAVRQDGSVWTWGNNSKSQLCDGSTTNRLSPVKLAVSGIARVSAGGHTTLLQGQDGAIYVCGDNQFGSLGIGAPLVAAEPTKLTAPATSHPVLAAGGNNAAFSPDGCAVRISGDNTYGVVGARETVTDSRTFIPRANLTLCAPRLAGPLGDVVNPAPRGGVSGCWAPRVEEDAARSPKFAPLVQAMLTAEELLKNNATFLTAPEPVRMRSSLSAGPSNDGGARIHIKAVAEHKMDGTRVWSSGCGVIPQLDRIGGEILQVSVFFNVDVRGQFFGPAGTPPKRTGTVAGYPEYEHRVLITKDGRLPWIPVTLGDKLDEEEARRVNRLAEWKKTVAGMKPIDEAAMQKAYDAVKTTDPAGAEKMLASMRESAVETKRQREEVAPRTTAALEKQIADLQKYRSSFSAADLAAPAVHGDPTGEGKRKVDAQIAAIRALPPAEQQQWNDLTRQGRAVEARAIRNAHTERVSPLITDALAQYDLAILKPGDRDRAIAVKPDPAFPNYAEPNRIQMITVMFSQELDPKQTARKAWNLKTKETFDYAALAALIR
jgi:alpha-tubulin suppressor-like RCC1 family protein